MANGWIKCSDQLPTKEDHYLTWSKYGIASVVHWCEGWNCHRFQGKIHNDFEMHDIVAWQPIEPFEAGEDQNG